MVTLSDYSKNTGIKEIKIDTSSNKATAVETASNLNFLSLCLDFIGIFSTTKWK